jgi:predicted nucleic acid-binding Zn ribbon protein
MTFRSGDSPRKFGVPNAQRARTTPQAAGKILSLALKRYGLDKDVAKYEFVLHWRSIMGDSIANRSRPEAIQGRTLVVRVSNPQWAQELAFQKDIILARLNRFLSETHTMQTVDDVRFVVGDIKAA